MLNVLLLKSPLLMPRSRCDRPINTRHGNGRRSCVPAAHGQADDIYDAHSLTPKDAQVKGLARR